MSDVITFEPGNYRYIRGVFQYSGGVAAQPGYVIERARFARPLPLQVAFAAVEEHLARNGRRVTAFAGCELRSPAQFTDEEFYAFNREYVTTLERWGIYRDGDQRLNPVARTNVCPVYGTPSAPVMSGFSYTVPARDLPARGTFVLAGGGDARAHGASYHERIVRPGDTSPEGLREKVVFVVDEMQRRLGLLGFTWADAVCTNAYTVQNIGHLVGEVLAALGACNAGLTWHYARPPVIGLEFEMDVQGVARDIIL
jgi:hypothetical protein